MAENNHTRGSSGSLVHLADRVLNRPLLIHPDKAMIVTQALAGRIGLTDVGGQDAAGPMASRFYGGHKRADGRHGMTPVTGGVAIITIAGSLVNRGAWVGASSGLVSYEGLTAQVVEAAADPEVHAVILDIDSGGGEAGGITSLAAAISALAAKKRTVAVVNDTACSAAYWIAAQADEIVISETSAVGSIGVVVLHVDQSAMLADIGLAPTLIHAGAHKVDGHPFGPLPDDVRSDIQTVVNDLYATFCASVSKGRGAKMTTAAARATEARVVYGKAAISAGLADRIGTFEATLEALQKRRPARSNQSKGNRMSDPEDNAMGAEALAAATANANAEGMKAGATAERGRIKAIIGSEAAATRPKLAAHLAFESDMTAEAAAGILSASGPEVAASVAIPSLAERAASVGDFGGDGGQKAEAYADVKPAEASAKEAQERQDRIVAKTNAKT